MKIDLHIHSIFSSPSFYDSSQYPSFWLDSVMEVEKILRVSKERELDMISITDHDTDLAEGYIRTHIKRPLIPTLRGCEFLTDLGDVLIFGQLDALDGCERNFFTLTQKARDLGFLVIGPHPLLNHPYGHSGVFCSNNRNKGVDFNKVAKHLDAVCCHNPINGISSRSLELAEHFNLAKVATSDAHVPSMLGSAFTEVENFSNPEEIIDMIKNRAIKGIYGSRLTPRRALRIIREAAKTQTISRLRKFKEVDFAKLNLNSDQNQKSENSVN